MAGFMRGKNGSSGRTRTYNPSVSSCTDANTDNYRLLRLSLKTLVLSHFQKRLSATYFERGSLKKSPKYFQALLGAKTRFWLARDGARLNSSSLTRKTRHAGGMNAGTALTRAAYEGGNNG